MSKQILITSILFFLCIFSHGTVHNVEAVECPSSSSYAIIYYNHQLLNQYVTTGTWSQAFGLSGPVGIKISPTGIVNAGNNLLNRTIDLVYTTPDCDCLSDTAESQVTVTITGSCVNGTLKMNIQEVYPDSSALVTCTGDNSCPVYTQPYPGTTTTFNLNMSYFNENTVLQPYTCPNCSGTYSWRLQFTDEPPPFDDINPVSIVPLLHLLLRQANQ